MSCDFICLSCELFWEHMNKYSHTPGRVPTTDPRLVCQTEGCIGHTFRMGDPQTATSLDASPRLLVSLIPPPLKGVWWLRCRKLSGQNLKVLMTSQNLPNMGDVDWPDQMERLVWVVTTTFVKIEVIVTLRGRIPQHMYICVIYICVHIGCEDQKTILGVIP